jgi:hypothetical protein
MKKLRQLRLYDGSYINQFVVTRAELMGIIHRVFTRERLDPIDTTAGEKPIYLQETDRQHILAWLREAPQVMAGSFDQAVPADPQLPNVRTTCYCPVSGSRAMVPREGMAWPFIRAWDEFWGAYKYGKKTGDQDDTKRAVIYVRD